MVHALESDRTGNLGLPLNPIYVRLVDKSIAQHGLNATVKQWKNTLRIGEDSWVWRYYSIGLVWLHWMAEPGGLKQMSEILDKKIVTILDLVVNVMCCITPEDWTQVVEEWVEAIGEREGALHSMFGNAGDVTSKTEGASAKRFCSNRAASLDLYPVPYRWSGEALHDIQMICQALAYVSRVVADSDEPSQSSEEDSLGRAGLGMVSRELVLNNHQSPSLVVDQPWPEKCIREQEKAARMDRIMKESEFKRTIKRPPGEVGLDMVHTILGDVLIIAIMRGQGSEGGVSENTELQGTAIIVSQVSGRYVELQPQCQVERLPEKLPWLLECEEEYVRSLLGGCTQAELCSLVILWLMLSGAIQVQGNSSCWANVQGTINGIDPDWTVPIKCDSWTFALPACLQHAVARFEGDEAGPGVVAILIKVNETSVLVYIVETEFELGDLAIETLHAKEGYLRRVSNMKGMRWHSKFRVPGLRLGADDLTGDALRHMIGFSDDDPATLFDTAGEFMEKLNLEVAESNTGTVTLRERQGVMSRWWNALDAKATVGYKIVQLEVSPRRTAKQIECSTLSELRTAIRDVITAKLETGVRPVQRQRLERLSAWTCASVVFVQQAMARGIVLYGRNTKWSCEWMVAQRDADGRLADVFVVDVPVKIPAGCAVRVERDMLRVRLNSENALSLARYGIFPRRRHSILASASVAASVKTQRAGCRELLVMD